MSGGVWRALRGWLLFAAVLGGGYAALHLWLLRPKPVAVRVRTIDRGIVERVVTNTRAGTIRARLSARVSPERSGRILRFAVREGERVAADATVAQLDDRVARARLELVDREIDSVAAQLEQARVRLRNAERDRARLERLFAEGNVPEQQIDDARARVALEKAAVAAAEAMLEQQRAQRALAEIELAKHRVPAPFAGVLTERYQEVGEWAAPAAPLFEIISMRDLYAWVEIDEVDSAELRPGLAVRVHLDAYPDTPIPGRLSRVGDRVSERREQSRTIEIEVAIERLPAGVRLLPGMSTDVEVVLERSPTPVVRVPTLALLEGARVLVADGGFARERRIETGIGNWEYTEVRSGLEPGERVIVSLDKEEIRDGVPIRIEADETPQPPATHRSEANGHGPASAEVSRRDAGHGD